MSEYHEPEIGDVYAFSDGTKFVIYKQLPSVDQLDDRYGYRYEVIEEGLEANLLDEVVFTNDIVKYLGKSKGFNDLFTIKEI